MKIVIQRVKRAEITVQNRTIAAIDHGYLVLLGVHRDDTRDDVVRNAKKIANLRIMGDDNGKMNRSVADVNGSILVVSQFTLLSDTAKGNRPSFIHAAQPQKAQSLYKLFIAELKKYGIQNVREGSFGTYMEVSLVNDGPVTIVL